MIDNDRYHIASARSIWITKNQPISSRNKLFQFWLSDAIYNIDNIGGDIGVWDWVTKTQGWPKCEQNPTLQVKALLYTNGMEMHKHYPTWPPFLDLALALSSRPGKSSESAECLSPSSWKELKTCQTVQPLSTSNVWTSVSVSLLTSKSTQAALLDLDVSEILSNSMWVLLYIVSILF